MRYSYKGATKFFTKDAKRLFDKDATRFIDYGATRFSNRGDTRFLKYAARFLEGEVALWEDVFHFHDGRN